MTHSFVSRDRIRGALDNVSLSIEPGEFVAVVGPSGCGKSTLLNLVAGFQRPTTGRVMTDGIEVIGPGADRGMVFQQHRLFPWMSVRKNVEYGLRMAGLPRDQVRSFGEQQLERVGLLDAADLAPYELSGGMQQRAAIARALAAEPRILLMDEPFSALDAFTRESLQEEIIEIWRRTGVTIVFITHSIDEAVFLGSRVVVMSAGPGRIIRDLQVEFSSSADYVHSRKRPEFGEIRDELSSLVRTVAADSGSAPQL